MAADDQPVRLVLVGAGRIATDHLTAIADHPDVQLVGIVDPDREAARARAGGFSAWTAATLEEAVGHGDADAAIIASPSSSHASLALAALRGGLHVMVEKPVAETSAEVREIDRVASECGRVATGAHVVRFLPTTRVLRDIVAAGGIGPVRQVVQRRMEFRAEPLPWWTTVDNFLLGHWGSHSIDAAIDVLGITVAAVLCRAQARSGPASFVDNVMLTGELADGGTMALSLSMESRLDRHEFLVVGPAGTVEIVDYSRVFHNGELVFDRPEVVVLRAGFAAQLDDFVVATKGGTPSAATVLSTLPCALVLEAAARSVTSGTIESVAADR